MNPAQPNVPNAEDACFQAIEQAYADSLAVQENTQKQIDALLKGFCKGLKDTSRIQDR